MDTSEEENKGLPKTSSQVSIGKHLSSGPG